MSAYYIKLDENRNPIRYPMLSANVQEVLEVSYLDQATLDKYGYAPFEWTPPPVNAHSTDTGEFYMGDDGVVRNRIVIREFTQQELLNTHVRRRREFLLHQCDWTVMPDSPLTTEQKAAWVLYRQALRDLTKTFPDAKTDADVTWPEPPSPPTTFI
jgi:hypothetical protein